MFHGANDDVRRQFIFEAIRTLQLLGAKSAASIMELLESYVLMDEEVQRLIMDALGMLGLHDPNHRLEKFLKSFQHEMIMEQEDEYEDDDDDADADAELPTLVESQHEYALVHSARGTRTPHRAELSPGRHELTAVRSLSKLPKAVEESSARLATPRVYHPPLPQNDLSYQNLVISSPKEPRLQQHDDVGGMHVTMLGQDLDPRSEDFYMSSSLSHEVQHRKTQALIATGPVPFMSKGAGEARIEQLRRANSAMSLVQGDTQHAHIVYGGQGPQLGGSSSEVNIMTFGAKDASHIDTTIPAASSKKWVQQEKQEALNIQELSLGDHVGIQPHVVKPKIAKCATRRISMVRLLLLIRVYSYGNVSTHGLAGARAPCVDKHSAVLPHLAGPAAAGGAGHAATGRASRRSENQPHRRPQSLCQSGI